MKETEKLTPLTQQLRQLLQGRGTGRHTLALRAKGQAVRENVGANDLKEHPPRGGNSFLSPGRNRGRLNPAHTGDNRGSAKGIDDFKVGVFTVHDLIIRHSLFIVKACLNPTSAMPN